MTEQRDFLSALPYLFLIIKRGHLMGSPFSRYTVIESPTSALNMQTIDVSC